MVILFLSLLLVSVLPSVKTVELYDFLANSSEDLRRLHLDENFRVIASTHHAVAPQDFLTYIEGIPVESLEENELHRYERYLPKAILLIIHEFFAD